MTLEQIKEILVKYNAVPKKSFGQNFLFDAAAIKKIIETAQLSSDDIVLEIGAGVGNLTCELAKTAGRVIASENDRQMLTILKTVFNKTNNVDIVDADILKFNELVLPKNYKIAANLPFYLAAPAIRKFLESRNPPSLMAVIVQKEVGQRMAAKPPKMSLLAVSVQFYANVKIACYIAKNRFWPAPAVDAAIVKIVPRQLKTFKQNREIFFKIVRAGFSQPRKQLTNNLAKGLNMGKEEVEKWLIQQGIKPQTRAQTLNIEQWEKLTTSFSGKNVL